jgi:hypothetical protein
MTTIDPAKLASALTSAEKAALLSLPARDRGHMPEDAWWAYYAILDAGLSTNAGDFMMVATPLGEAVIRHLSTAPETERPVR